LTLDDLKSVIQSHRRSPRVVLFPLCRIVYVSLILDSFPEILFNSFNDLKVSFRVTKGHRESSCLTLNDLRMSFEVTEVVLSPFCRISLHHRRSRRHCVWSSRWLG